MVTSEVEEVKRRWESLTAKVVGGEKELKNSNKTLALVYIYHSVAIERFHSRGQQPCQVIGKESVYMRKELNTYRIGWVQQHGRRDVM